MRKTRRVFFALNPDDDVRRWLADNSPQLSRPARAVPLQNIHMTLVFIGAVADTELDCLQSAVDAIEHPAFSLEIDQPGYFKKAAIVWLGCSQPPQSLFELHRKLLAAAGSCVPSLDSRALVPHLSIYRKAIKADREISELADSKVWQVNRLELLESVPVDGGVKYETIKTWPLSQSS